MLVRPPCRQVFAQHLRAASSQRPYRLSCRTGRVASQCRTYALRPFSRPGTTPRTPGALALDVRQLCARRYIFPALMHTGPHVFEVRDIRLHAKMCMQHQQRRYAPPQLMCACALRTRSADVAAGGADVDLPTHWNSWCSTCQLQVSGQSLSAEHGQQLLRAHPRH